VETKVGYHIIRVTDRKEAILMTFEEAKDRIINELTQKSRQEIVREYVESLKAEANIVYPPGEEPIVSEPVVKQPKPAPADSNAPAKSKDANAVE